VSSSKGGIFKVYQVFYKEIVKILWNSQRKKLKKIGHGSRVQALPLIEGYRYIEIGDNFYCGNDVRIEAWESYADQKFTPRIIINNNVTFTDRCYLSCIEKIEIGDGVLLGRDVFITDNSHGNSDMIDLPPLKRPLVSKGCVIIEKNVWIGRQVTILSGVTIGENAIVGANSVVVNDIPANCVAVGSPAKVVKLMKNI